MKRTGAAVKPRTLGREVPGSSPPVAVRCGLEQKLIVSVTSKKKKKKRTLVGAGLGVNLRYF